MKIKSFFLFVIFAIFLAACEKHSEQVTLQGKTMGTTYTVKYISDPDMPNLPNAETVQSQLSLLLEKVNNEMSTYRKDSMISQFNDMHEVNKEFPVSADFIKVIREATRLHKVTEGALDVTVGKLVNLWGFGPDRRLNKVPTAEQITELAPSIGLDKLKVTEDGISKYNSNLYLDLSSIAKGFGVDKLAEHLESLGVNNYLVEIGGELRGKGKNIQGKDWRIAIEKPTLFQGEDAQIIVPLHNLGMATSGNYRNYFEDEQGNRLSHIINPKKLRPVRHNLASVTVLAPSTMTADGLATGLFVLGAQKSLEIAEREKLPVFLIIKNGDKFETQMSSEFKKLINP